MHSQLSHFITFQCHFISELKPANWRISLYIITVYNRYHKLITFVAVLKRRAIVNVCIKMNLFSKCESLNKLTKFLKQFIPKSSSFPYGGGENQ